MPAVGDQPTHRQAGDAPREQRRSEFMARNGLGPSLRHSGSNAPRISKGHQSLGQENLAPAGSLNQCGASGARRATRAGLGGSNTGGTRLPRASPAARGDRSHLGDITNRPLLGKSLAGKQATSPLAQVRPALIGRPHSAQQPGNAASKRASAERLAPSTTTPAAPVSAHICHDGDDKAPLLTEPATARAQDAETSRTVEGDPTAQVILLVPRRTQSALDGLRTLDVLEESRGTEARRSSVTLSTSTSALDAQAREPRVSRGLDAGRALSKGPARPQQVHGAPAAAEGWSAHASGLDTAADAIVEEPHAAPSSRLLSRAEQQEVERRAAAAYEESRAFGRARPLTGAGAQSGALATSTSSSMAPPASSSVGAAAALATSTTGSTEAAALSSPSPFDNDAASPFDNDAADIQRVAEYATEIFDQLFREEQLFLPRANYMEQQTDINARMRTILVDWLVEVHMKYRLRRETLFLTVNLIDRFLTSIHVMRTRLQLVGVVAMFIAAKFEEIDPPLVSDFVYITDNAYTRDDILIMECTMLTVLDFQIVTPTAAHFLERLQRANRCDEVQKEVSQYLLELSLLELPMVRYPPSHIVAAALLLSNELIGRRPAWPVQVAGHAPYTEGDIRGCVDELRGLLEAAPGSPLQAVRRKFSSSQHRAVATMNFNPAL